MPGKNLRLFNGAPLYRHFLDRLVGLPFDQVYVDTDNGEIAAAAEKLGFGVIQRIPELALDGANGNDLLLYDASQIEADIYFQLFVTAPLLRQQTIVTAVQVMKQETEYDSLFTAVQLYSWFWFEGRPVNYDPSMLPRSQDARPIVRETTGLYAIRADTLWRGRCRIGAYPYILFVDELEAIDVDTDLDFAVAELFASRMNE